MSATEPAVQEPGAGRRRGAFRVVVLVAIALAIGLLLSLCTRIEDQVEFLSCVDEGRRDLATLTGHVATAEAAPIADATLEFVDVASGTTDADGRVVLNDLPPGPHRLRVTAEGYRSLDAAVDLPGCDVGVNVVLRKDGLPFFGPIFGPYL